MSAERSLVVIILANLMNRDGDLNAETAGRVELGCREAGRRLAERILFMGWAYREDSALPVSEAMRRYAERKALCPGIPMEVDTVSRDTVGDALFSKLRLRDVVAQCNLLVATSDYHVARTRLIFSQIWGRDQSLEIIGAPTKQASERKEQEADSTSAFLRTFSGVTPGDTEGFLRRLIASHPFYNGDAMPDRPFLPHPFERCLEGPSGS